MPDCPLEQQVFQSEPFICPDSPADLQSHHTHARSAALDIVGRPPFSASPALNAEIVSESDCGSYVRKKVRYGNASDDIVWAWLMLPKAATRPAPAIVCLAGSSMTKNYGKDAPAGISPKLFEEDPEGYGHLFAELGYVVICPDYPCAGERLRAGLKPYDTSDLDACFPDWSRVGMSLWDVSRAVDCLESLPQVDMGRVGVTGWSQGGDMSLWGAAFDDRIAAAVSVCGWSVWRNRLANGIIATYNYPRLARHLQNASPLLPTDMDHIAATIAPKPFLNITGLQDAGVPNIDSLLAAECELAKLYKLLGVGEKFSAAHLDHEHRYSAEAHRLSVEWFGRWL